jgi:hypothetical protein
MIDRCCCYISEKKHRSRARRHFLLRFLIKDSCTAKKRSPELFRMSALGSSRPLRRGERRLKSNTFDLLCPELLDNIVEKVARDSPSSFAQLARVDRAFRDATRRCSQTLVIWRPRINLRPNKKGEEPQRACREMSLRPKLSKLVVKAGDTNRVNAGLWEAVSKFQWTSIVTDDSLVNEPCAKFFSSSQTCLRRLDVDAGGYLHLNSCNSDIRTLIQAFPKLEELTVFVCSWTSFYRFPSDDSTDDESESSDVGDNGRQDSNSLTRLYLAHSTKLLGVSRLAKHFKNAGKLEAISSLKFGCFDDGQDVFPENTFSQWTRLQVLHLEVMTDNLRDCTLQRLADQCPSLRELVLRLSPYHETRTTPSREPFHISDVLLKCPKLQRLLISRSEVVEEADFSKLVREVRDAAGQWFVFKGPALREGTVLVREFTEESDAVSCLKECSLYRAVLLVYQEGPPSRIAPGISRNRSASARHVIGESATVQSWCRVFGERE